MNGNFYDRLSLIKTRLSSPELLNNSGLGRAAEPAEPFDKAFRLLGVSDAEKPYFYWGKTPAQNAGYLRPGDPIRRLGIHQQRRLQE
jgi:hypothetical protein